MVEALWVLAVVAVVFMATYGAEALRARLQRAGDDANRLLVRRRVIVNLTTGSAVQGVVWEKRGGFLVIRQAALIESRGPTPVDGEVLVEMSRVEFLQALPGGVE